MPAGHLIAIEGIDASGKGTQATLLRERFEAEGRSCALLSFPRYGRTFFAEAITRYLNGGFGELADLDPALVSLLYAGDRFETRDELTGLLKAHDVVVLDRYVASNLAHQAARVPQEDRGEFVTWLSRLEYEVYGLPRAELTILLDVSAATSARLLERKAPRTYTDAKADLHEADTGYMEACRNVYRWLAERGAGGEWAVVPVEGADREPRPIERVHADVAAAAGRVSAGVGRS